MRKLGFLLLTSALLASALFETQAQTSSVLYGASRNPHMNSVNPAFFPSNSSLYLSLPSANVNLNSPLAYSDIFQYDSTQQITYINANNILDSLQSDGRLRFATNVHAVGMGLRLGKTFVTLSSQAKLDVGLGIPEGLVTFVNEGNANNAGDGKYLELLDGELLTLRAYGEIAVGLGHTFDISMDGKLTLGGRAKMLVGYYDLSTAGSSLRLYTGEDYSSLTADVNLMINNTSAVPFLKDENGNVTGIDYSNINYFPNNRGVGFDLGARLELGFLDFSLSVLDFGPGIHWQDGVQQIVSARDTNMFTFTGLDITGLVQSGKIDSTYTSALVDSLRSLAEYTTVDGEAYWTAIPTKLNVGAMMHVTQGLTVGLLFHGQFNRGLVKLDDVFKTKVTGFSSNTTVMARLNILDWVELVGCASMLTNNGRYSWFNPGFGVTLTPLRVFQVYAMMDYISNQYIVDTKNLNVTVGLNLLFGSRVE